jgi:hypothetical protein
MGYRVGICANSDGHKGRPGSSYPGASDFGSYGGLTCVLAQTLDRESIVASLNARHFYATTGNRCLVDVKLETEDGQIAMIGDIVNTETNSAQLHVKVVGTAPIECVQIRNGLEVVKTLRPFDKADLGNRVKIVWSGAERRGRFRSVRWDGGLQVHGNTILNAVPVNFWNADCPLVKKGNDRLEWQSVTTGGLCGVILTLEKSDAGSFEIKTLQRNIEGEFAATGLEPEEWECPVGIDKRISIYRLPDQSCPEEFTFSLPMTKLRQGDNPIYIRLTQEDGHMAWSSPIFWV